MNLNRKKIIFFSLLLIILLFVLFRQFFPSTPGINNKGDTGMGKSIASLEKIKLGNMDQWILMRGNDISNPVLLWLHGGPGSSQMPVSRYFNKDLEKDFVVVHWDQRGAGKSNPPDFDENTLVYDQFIKDAHELTIYLKKRFNTEKIYILGHSWGTQIGIKLAQDYPDDYYAYIGVSQVVNNVEGDNISYEWLKKQVSKNKRDSEKLEELGSPPYTSHDNFVKFIKLIDSYGGGMDVGMGKLALIALLSREYRPSDYICWMNGSTRGSGPMWESLQSFNLFNDTKGLKIPVFFFSGENDYNTPMKLVEYYFNTLDAPKGKYLILFKNSSHAPFMAEPEKFYEELNKVKEKTYFK